MAVWAETATGGHRVSGAAWITDDTWPQGLSVFGAGSTTLQSPTPAQLPEAGVSQQRVVRSPKWVIEELAFC